MWRREIIGQTGRFGIFVSGCFCLLLFFFLPQDFLPNSFLLETTLSLGLQLPGTELWTWNLCQLSYFYLLGPKFLSVGDELNRAWSRVVSACLFHWLCNLPFLLFCFLFLFIGCFWPNFCGFLRTGIDYLLENLYIQL